MGHSSVGRRGASRRRRPGHQRHGVQGVSTAQLGGTSGDQSGGQRLGRRECRDPRRCVGHATSLRAADRDGPSGSSALDAVVRLASGGRAGHGSPSDRVQGPSFRCHTGSDRRTIERVPQPTPCRARGTLQGRHSVGSHGPIDAAVERQPSVLELAVEPGGSELGDTGSTVQTQRPARRPVGFSQHPLGDTRPLSDRSEPRETRTVEFGAKRPPADPLGQTEREP